MKRPIVVGLTGGIASGKSTVLKEFKRLGAKIIDSDEIAHRIILKGTPAYKKIVRVFGEYILRPNREIDRKKLGNIIFSDSKRRKILEKITHPVIIDEIKKEINRFTRKVIIIDAPLLFEAGLTAMVDKIIVVWIPKKLQIDRLIKRNKLTYKQAKQQISAQMPLKTKKKLADYLIDNTQPLPVAKDLIKKFLKNVLTKIQNIGIISTDKNFLKN